MCGIAGFIGQGDESSIRKMTELISHRGPDYTGVYYHEAVGLGHTRLSIIDLDARSHQPFFSSDNQAAIVFNGEIYNFSALKQELIETGRYYFRTSSDTEVLLNAYLEYGVDCLKKIHGMFAFAIYDFSTRELFLARDRMGKKPLYYAVVGQTIVFASELKSVAAHPLITKSLNPDALNAYLTFDYIPTTDSILSGVHKLPPSSYMVFSDGKIAQQNTYWEVSFTPRDISFRQAKEELDNLLNQAVMDRMISDVPLGVFLSGGLDSSAIAYYAQKNATKKVETFSIGFSEKSFDESSYARLLAKKLNTVHHEKILSAAESLRLIPEIMQKLDEPFADPSIIPTYFLSAFTREYVTVALGGDGSDELLAGYPTFISDIFSPVFRSIPQTILQIVNHLAGFLPPSDSNISLDFKITQFLKGFEGDAQYTHSLWLGSFTPKMKQQLLEKGFAQQMKNGNGMKIVDQYFSKQEDMSYFNKVLYTYYRTYLQDDILVKVDRASMFNALEVRAPFLDTRVVEFLSSLPRSYKIKGFSGKHLLKEMMRDKIPNEIIDRPKKGFGIPVSLWLREELKPLMLDMLSSERLKKQGIFDAAYVHTLIREHLSKKQNHRKLLWNLLVFQLWMDNHYN